MNAVPERPSGYPTTSAHLVMVLVLLLAACSAPVAVAPTATVVPSTATPPPPTATPEPTSVPEEDEGVWDYVSLGDCVFGGNVAFGKSYPNVYAAYIAEDLGVEVKLHNRCALSESTVSLLDKLQNNETTRQEISEAEVITVWVGAIDIFGLIYGKYQGEEPPVCGPIGDMDMDCIGAAMQVQEDNFDALLARMVSIRGTDQALIRIADGCNFFVEYLVDAGAFEQLEEPVFARWNEAVHDLAAKYSIPVVRTRAAFNGPDGDEPIPPEYRQSNPSDWYHVNEAGHVLIADLHRAVGYDYGP